MSEAVCLPTPEEKSKAKDWVEAHSCRAWRHGCIFVDGTLIPLHDQPHWYGESYFDWKCNYSLNIQVCYHLNQAWNWYSAQEHDTILEENEFVWADLAYPLETWVVSPYKKPERDIPKNEEFNNHLSMVRIHSKHVIGFLKGRFHSLKHLQLHISDERSQKFATYWIAACIGVYAFIMQCEDEEQEDVDSDFEDPFIAEGLSPSSSSSDSEPTPQSHQGNTSQRRLHATKAKCKKLK
ncbi:hypothetical protein PILCRDRAFT_76885 [Piloderma croceum F 1598]|uniref:DDE Tnp4 domain-containing protein n=1 Tax=Piloderma croceum (strain F 1598) TaxID=765440 RepID=A0A0C3BIZ0_PILCF|nr:hypothetical protein PILCRDRAFT_76885 [Piloderma croceum F 1598]